MSHHTVASVKELRSIQEMRLFHWLSAFQVLFYPGSHVHKDCYSPLLQEVEIQTGEKIMFMNGSFFQPWTTPKVFKEPTLLMGHSLGGYLALLDALRHPQSVKGVVLLHSHFNSRGKAIYPRVSQKKVEAPVLTILASDDERLPFRVALDDVFEKVKERMYNKHYVINPHLSHFSGCTPSKTNDTSLIASQITQFIRDVHSDNFTMTRQLADASRWDSKIPSLIPGILLSRSTSLFDALLQVVMLPCVWESWHWLWFLLSKPDMDMNYFYETSRHVYLKTYNLPVGHLQNKIRELSYSRPVDFHCIDLPSLHPFIMTWLTCPLFVTKNMTFPILKYRVNQNVTYYKIPHPNQVLERQILD